MARRKLPIGIQTFREVREDNCYYVDKTAFMRRLVSEGKHYFLSRPRRFGKSLLLDTLKELFEGNEALFAELHIHERWDWSAHHPVLRLDFGSGNFKEPGYLHANLMAQLDGAEERAGMSPRYDTAPERFGHLIRGLHARAGRPVVVLVDEYDRPILDALEAPDIARANRDYLCGLYAVIKTSDAHVRFTFLTGVSKFSKVSLFSGLNNLTDITLDPRYSAICGYTDADLDTVFAPELPGLDRDGHPRLVQRLPLARRGGGVQPFRHPPALRQARVRRLVVRDRHPGVPGRDPGPAPHHLGVPRRDARHQRPAVGVRRGRHRNRSAAVPDRLPDHCRGGRPRRAPAVSARLSEPGGAPEPERASAALPGEGPRRARWPTACGCTGCWRPTTSRGWRSCSMRSSRASPTSGTPTTTSRTTRATTRACSTPTSRPWG